MGDDDLLVFAGIVFLLYFTVGAWIYILMSFNILK